MSEPAAVITPILRDGKIVRYWFHCPGCGYGHGYSVHPQGHPRGLVWEWNGDMVRPTFSPSLLTHGLPPYPRCHLFLRDGRIEYCSDCEHELAGKTVEMKPV